MKASMHNFRVRRGSPSWQTDGRVGSDQPAKSPGQPLSPSHRSAGPSSRHSAIPACDRCRSFKKRCSRTFPVCNLCATAGRKCSYSSVSTTSDAEVRRLRARVKWLSDYINNELFSRDNSGERVEDIETGSTILGSTHPAATLDGPGLISPTDLDSSRPRVGQTTAYQGSASSIQASTEDLANGNNPSPNTSARRFVDAYFRNNHKAYPLVNQTKILEGLGTFGDFAQRLQDSQSTLLYLVMSIGCTTLERAGQVPRNTAKRFEVAYAEIIQECVCQDSIESVQILMLLALYSLFDPAGGASTYSIVSIAARRAITIGLTRRLADEHTYPPAEIELRHRLYWSVLALDRLMSVAQGLPVALTDENADVPLPSLTVEEFAGAERSTHARKLQTSRHIIVLRQLESRVLEQIHLRKQAEVAELAPSDRRATLSSLRASIEDWYSQGCLMPPMESDGATVHSSFAWLSARYYHLLLLLYYPNHFNSSAAAVTRQQIFQFAQRQLQFTSALFQQRQLPLNCNTLYRLMPICMVLMQDFTAACIGRTNFAAQTRDSVAVLISILESFSEEWVLAHRTARVMRQFAGIMMGGKAFFSDEDMTTSPLGTTVRTVPASRGDIRREPAVTEQSLQALMKSCIVDLISVMRQMLGQSTCFQFCEYASDDAKPKGHPIATETLPPHLQADGQYQSPSLFPTLSQIFCNSNEASEVQEREGGIGDGDQAMSYGWGALDMEFM